MEPLLESRSTFYTRKAHVERVSVAASAKRGPKTPLSDKELLDLVRHNI